MINDWKYCIVQMPRSCFCPSCFTQYRGPTGTDHNETDSSVFPMTKEKKNHPWRFQKLSMAQESPQHCPALDDQTPSGWIKIPRELWSLGNREVAAGRLSPCWNHKALFRFTAICGLVPLYALLTVSGRREGPRGPCRAHPQSLETSALRANTDVATAPRNQGSFLCQSVGEGFRQSGTPAQLAVAEAGGGGAGSTLLQR